MKRTHENNRALARPAAVASAVASTVASTSALGRRQVRVVIALAVLIGGVCGAAREAAAQPRAAAAAQKASAAGAPALPGQTGALEGFKSYPSPYYTVHTDLDEDGAREAVIRMTRMAEEYHERTKGFAGAIRARLPFYLFAKRADYYAAGGRPGSAGVFNGQSLMAMAIPGKHGPSSPLTWHVVQHEGFHQFVHAVIGGDIPIWVNEGLAEYFGESVFTGDGFVTGLVPPYRLARVKQHLAKNEFKTVKEMMETSPQQWNAELALTNYDQAWSMVHFLAHGEGGKYQSAFSGFMNDVGRGSAWEKAWETNFGNARGFEQKWQAYWAAMGDNATADLYAKATVATLTSFAGRAFSQKQTFDSFDELVKSDPKTLKSAPADWLPPGVFAEAADRARALAEGGAKFTLAALPNKMPQVSCVLGDGARVTGRFTLRGGQIGPVQADVVPSIVKPAGRTPVKK